MIQQIPDLKPGNAALGRAVDGLAGDLGLLLPDPAAALDHPALQVHPGEALFGLDDRLDLHAAKLADLIVTQGMGGGEGVRLVVAFSLADERVAEVVGAVPGPRPTRGGIVGRMRGGSRRRRPTRPPAGGKKQRDRYY